MFNQVSRIIVAAFVFYNIILLEFICSARKVRYISTEHATVTYYDRKYFKFVNLTSQRYGRSDPFYYVDIHVQTLVTFSNNFTLNFYFYEFLSNVYKRGFIEMHSPYCDFIRKDNFFGTPLRQGKFLRPCPHPPDLYSAYNMTVVGSVIPPGFPFTKGRIYTNITLTGTKDVIASGFVKMEIKEVNVKNKP